MDGLNGLSLMRIEPRDASLSQGGYQLVIDKGREVRPVSRAVGKGLNSHDAGGDVFGSLPSIENKIDGHIIPRLPILHH